MDFDVPSPTPSPARPPGGIADRLWQAARVEFALRGYHGARVQGIARRAGCNVALLYRHWPSKKGLYLDLVRSVCMEVYQVIDEAARREEGAVGMVRAYLDAMLADGQGAQILMREYLDGGPFLLQLMAEDPTIGDSLARYSHAFTEGPVEKRLRPELNPRLALITVSGFASLISASQTAAQPFLEGPVSIEARKQHLAEILLHGLLRASTR
ncbi:MAG TPA: TetR/AcrR family transcriptional regulator [Anaeromyxobacteraceae bacterium]|jgi:AcrR family transcriptional regulator|nr:TetR/AcrR family transcriptional regulator [Anaeromyxobacteraceae bacterium]